MSTLFFILACVILGVVVLSKIPGLEHFVKPIIDLIFTIVKAVIVNGTAWSIFIFKNLLSSHTELLKHLLFSAEELDPSHNMRD